MDMGDVDATLVLHQPSEYLCRYYGKKVIILLDEYDTSMQEAYVHGYWEELAAFTKSMFNSAYQTNPWLERGIMTGITRVSKESIFSDINHLKVITTTSDEYEKSFGFTEEEVFAALDEFGMGEEREKVKWWYDSFIFGESRGIYNPCSILNLLDTGKLTTYWANTSSNGLVVNLDDWYEITSNRESGFGRYDILLEPKQEKQDAIVIEFKYIIPESITVLRIPWLRRFHRSRKRSTRSRLSRRGS